MKTQLQLRHSGSGPRYKGPLDCVRQITKTQGVLALYTGVNTLITGSFVKAGVRFVVFDKLKEAFTPKTGKPTATHIMLAGLGAGVCEAVIAVTPTESLKTRLIQDASQPEPRFKGMVHAATTIFKEEGIRGLYRGLVPTMLKQGCNQASRFAVYTGIMSLIDKWPGRSKLDCPPAISSDFAPRAVVPYPAGVSSALRDEERFSKENSSGANATLPSSSSSSSLSHQSTSQPLSIESTSYPASSSPSSASSSSSPSTPTQVPPSPAPKKPRVSPLQSLAAGAAAGFTSVYITMPFDVVKVRHPFSILFPFYSSPHTLLLVVLFGLMPFPHYSFPSFATVAVYIRIYRLGCKVPMLHVMGQQ